MVVPAVFLRACVFGTYMVTTPSMEPALAVGEHVAAWRSSWIGAPQPWDIVLLDTSVDDEIPDDADALIKRVISAPTERSEFVSLRDGDVWAGEHSDALAIRRRPPALRDAMLVTVHAGEIAGSPWQGTGYAAGAEGGWTLRGEPSTELRYGRAVRDGDTETPGHDVVHDTGLLLVLTRPPTDGDLRLRLREGADIYEAELRFDGAHLRLVLHHNLGGGRLAEAECAAPAPGARLRFLNVDDQLTLDADGEPCLVVDVPAAVELPPGAALNNEPTLSWSGPPLELGALAVLRDVHYTKQGHFGTSAEGGFPSREVAPGELFVLGDDSGRSRDSRHLKKNVPASAVLGRPFATYLPAESRRWLDRRGL